MNLLTNVLAFIAVIGILVTVHEFGHFWVARRCGVRVLRFSIGFGRVIARRFDRDGTEYAISAIPLGGYVKMLDEREAPVAETELDRAFNRKPLWQRNAIILAGPVFNFLFAILVYWALFLMGDTVLRPVVSEPPAETAAAAAGFRGGDEITAVAGEPVVGWNDVVKQLLAEGTGNSALAITVATAEGNEATRRLDVAGIGPVGEQPNVLRALGLLPKGPPVPPVVERVQPGSAAEQAGLRADDRVVAAGGEAIDDWRDLSEHVDGAAGEPLQLSVEREGGRRELTVAVPDNGTIGVYARPPEDSVRQRYYRELDYGPLAALGRGVNETWDQGVLMVTMTAKIITGEASTKNLSGPINIAQYAGDSVGMGPGAFLTLLALISISLGVINLLPVPVLDGGHLLFNACEWVLGRPLSDQAQAVGNQVGFAIILLLMGFAFYNDLIRILGAG